VHDDAADLVSGICVSEISIRAENPAGIFQGFAVPIEQLC
jgi:hypothetical protein